MVAYWSRNFFSWFWLYLVLFLQPYLHFLILYSANLMKQWTRIHSKRLESNLHCAVSHILLYPWLRLLFFIPHHQPFYQLWPTLKWLLSILLVFVFWLHQVYQLVFRLLSQLHLWFLWAFKVLDSRVRKYHLEYYSHLRYQGILCTEEYLAWRLWQRSWHPTLHLQFSLHEVRASSYCLQVCLLHTIKLLELHL